MSTIHYRAMVQQMDETDHKNGRSTCDLVYLKVHRSKRTGGQWVKLTSVQKCGLPYHCNDNEMRGFKDARGKVTPVHLRLVFEFNDMRVYP